MVADVETWKLGRMVQRVLFSGEGQKKLGGQLAAAACFGRRQWILDPALRSGTPANSLVPAVCTLFGEANGDNGGWGRWASVAGGWKCHNVASAPSNSEWTMEALRNSQLNLSLYAKAKGPGYYFMGRP